MSAFSRRRFLRDVAAAPAVAVLPSVAPTPVEPVPEVPLRVRSVSSPSADWYPQRATVDVRAEYSTGRPEACARPATGGGCATCPRDRGASPDDPMEVMGLWGFMECLARQRAARWEDYWASKVDA